MMTNLPAPSLRDQARGRTLLAALAAVAIAVAAGCYDPTIAEKFKCNTAYEPGSGDCPDGFHCSGGLCLRGSGGGGGGGGSDSGVLPDVKPDMHPDAMDATSEPAPEAPVCTPPMPIMGCTPDTSKKCDPVCQSGCTGCNQKCSAVTGTTTATYTCNTPLMLRPKMLGEGCNISSLGLPAQTDDCAPGLVCRQDNCATHCAKFCKTDADCPNSTCTIDVGGGVKVCDVPTVSCNPVKINNTTAGCSGANQGCYLSMTGTDRTVCDCPVGAGSVNSACTFTLDCFPGLVCVNVGGFSTCHQVCSLAAGANDCIGSSCGAYMGSKKFGYCN
jgi:hypothetical protein